VRLLGYAAKVAAAEELREAGQRKIAGFAERAAAAEKQAREASARLRALESGQAALRVSGFIWVVHVEVFGSM